MKSLALDGLDVAVVRGVVVEEEEEDDGVDHVFCFLCVGCIGVFRSHLEAFLSSQDREYSHKHLQSKIDR